MLFGVGIGYQYSNWLRFDVTGEYRGETGFHGFDTWTDFDGNARFNNYTAKKSELVALANVYFDLGTWYGVTPFIGAGIGGARVTMHSFRDAGIDGFGSPTMAFAKSASQWNFAWAVHAGLAYRVNSAFTVELAYRYLNMGDGKTGDIIAFDGTNNINNPMLFKDLDSHDVKLGLRWHFNAPQPVYAPPPLVTKG
jgi:opacity protein-like surface antigen